MSYRFDVENDPFEVENDLHDGWTCSGCRFHFPETSAMEPQLEIDDPGTSSTLKFCVWCVEDGRFPQPTDEIVVVTEETPAESIWSANWDRSWSFAAAAWIGVCAVAGLVAGVLR
jgi:hypothetical protein